MGLVQKYFLRNCFGPTPHYYIVSIDHNEIMHAEPHQLISTLTYVEEVTIRSINTPTSIMKPNMGNIGSHRKTLYI